MQTWVENDPRIHKGSVISFKGLSDKWEVINMGDTIEKDCLNRNWHVGGL